MRLVQQTMLPDSRPLDLIELVGRGLLLRRVGPARRPGTEAPDEVTLDFLPGVRDELLADGRRSDSTQVLLTAARQPPNGDRAVYPHRRTTRQEPRVLIGHTAQQQRISGRQDPFGEPVLRVDDPVGWFDRIYRDELIITQLDDGATPPGEAGRRISSSSSMPSVMLRMLDELQVFDGCRVLEIGTGSGWNAGLLSARLGASNVVSVDVDPAVAAHAEAALKAAGQPVTVVVGDGAAGYVPGAPYDRVIATCAVRHIPYEWVTQTRPGGLIVTPWGTLTTRGPC
jgi:protein-L-isoaspartate O-methyltransferase